MRPQEFAISEAVFAKNLGFGALSSSDQALYENLRQFFSKQRAQILQHLAILETADSCKTQRVVRELRRELWVLAGLLDHGISYELLVQIVETYEKIDAVPSHHMHPKLFQGSLDRPQRPQQ